MSETRPLATAYATLLTSLADHIRREFVWPSPDGGFAEFVFHKAGEEGPLPSPAGLSWPADDRLVHAPALAAAGFWIGCGEGRSIRSSWLDGVERLSLRDAFPADRQSFVHRPVELLGITVGVAALPVERPHITTWLKGVLERARKDPAADQWTALLRQAGDILINARTMHPSAVGDEASLHEIAAARWLSQSVGALPLDREQDQAILRRAILEMPDRLDLARAAVVFQAVRATVSDNIESEVEKNWQVGRERRDAESLVLTLCRRFHLFAQQLLHRHSSRPTIEIVDEYDVQDVMHALLRFHFDDVRAEEVTPSMGGKSGRMDFLLKREQLIVETKMTRKSLAQKDVGDELIIDMKRYRSHPDYRTLICLVYDPSGFCHSPAALETDLSGTDGDLRTFVVVCPQGM